MPGVVEKKLLEDDPIISDIYDSDDGDDDAEQFDDDDGVQEPMTEEQLAIKRMLDFIEMKFDTLLKNMKMELESLSNRLEMKLGNIERMQGYSMMMGQQTLVLLKAIANRMGIDIAEVLSQLPVRPTPFHGPGPSPVPTTGSTEAAQPDPNSSSPAPAPAVTAVDARPAFASRDGATTADTSYPAVVYLAPAVAHAIAAAVAAAIPTSEIPPP